MAEATYTIVFTMPALSAVIDALHALAPLRLAAAWDSVGLLIAPGRDTIDRVMTCLTVTSEVVAEAVRDRVDLVVAHHPLPFRPLARVTPDTGPGRAVLELVRAGAGIWSSHTAWDSAAGGVNDLLATLLGLAHVAPIEPDRELPQVGFGRVGTAPAGRTVADLATAAASALGVRHVQLAGDTSRPAGRVGIVCGSGGESVAEVARAGCDTLFTGEIKLHDAIAARDSGLAVIAVGHHASERFSMDAFARRLAAAVPGLACHASRDERDPLDWL